MRRAHLVLAASLTLAAALPVVAQDAVKADPKHYKVEFENDEIRVLRITYGPGEKSVMHSHPPNLAIFLSDGKAKFTLPDGKTVDAPIQAGTTEWDPKTGTHLPENVGDKPFSLVLVEVKAKPAAAAPSSTK